MLKSGILFETVSTSTVNIIQLQKNGDSITEAVNEIVQKIDEIDMQVSFPEQQTSGGAIIVAAKLLLPAMKKEEMIALAPFFHSGLELLSSFDKLPSFRWQSVRPLFHFYMDAIPKEAPTAIKFLEVMKKILDVMRLSITVTENFFSYENIFSPARVVAVTMEIVKNPDTDLALRKLALDVLSRVVRQCPPKKVPTVEIIVSGILSGLLRVIKLPSNNAELLESAINLFTDAVILVFADDAEKFDIRKVNLNSLPSNTHFFFANHNDRWRADAEVNIYDYMKEILSRHMRHRMHNVKMAVCEMVLRIQENCSNVFGAKLYNCILFIYTNFRYDDAVYFQDLAMACLPLVKDKKEVEQFFYKELESVVNRLPVQVRCGHGDRELKILSAVLDGLGEAISLMCTTGSPVIEQVIRSIVDCVVIDNKAMRITSEGVPETVDQHFRKFKMMHNLSHNGLKNITRILTDLGKFEIIEIVHNLMKVESAGRRASYHLLLAHMLANLKKNEASPDEPTIMMLAEYLVKETNRSCVIYLKDDDQPRTEGFEYDWNTCIESLSCTNVALCMKFISGTANRSNIGIKSICTILNQSNSTSYIVTETADFALKIIADHDDNVNDVLELVWRYSSYILNAVSLACSSSENYHMAPLLLRAYLRYERIDDKFDHFSVIVDKILLVLDNNEQKYTIALLQALQAFVAAMRREYLDLQPIAPSEDSEDYKCLPTAQHSLIERILLRTKHMLTSPHLPVKLTCLQILADGLDVLKNYDDILLPMIHQNWHGVMVIVKEKDPLTMTPVFEVISEMADKSGSFMHNKVLKEFWPEAGSFMMRCIEQGNHWQYTAEYRFVIRSFELMPHLIINSGFTEQEANSTFMTLLTQASSVEGSFTKFGSTQKLQIERHYKVLAMTGRKT